MVYGKPAGAGVPFIAALRKFPSSRNIPLSKHMFMAGLPTGGQIGERPWAYQRQSSRPKVLPP
jgi:hypothetical protein